MSTYSRLKNLIRDQIEHVDTIEHQVQQYTEEGWTGASFEPESLHRIHPFDYENAERINQWLEETLCFVILKKKNDRKRRESEILHLFRLLCIKFRIEHPYRGHVLPVKQNLVDMLESKICSCLMLYFDHQSTVRSTSKDHIDKQNRQRSRS